MSNQPEALEMANRLDDESSIQGIFGTRVAVRLCADVARLLREQHAEIERLRAEVERLDLNGIHSCHDNCERLPCVQRREIERLRAENLRAFDSGYDKGVQDTLLDYGVEL